MSGHAQKKHTEQPSAADQVLGRALARSANTVGSTVPSIDETVAYIQKSFPSIAHLYPQLVEEWAESYWWKKRDYTATDTLSPEKWLDLHASSAARTYGVNASVFRCHVMEAAAKYHNWPDDPNYHSAAAALNAWDPKTQDLEDIVETLSYDELTMAVFVTGQWWELTFSQRCAGKRSFEHNARSAFWSDVQKRLKALLSQRQEPPSPTQYIQDMSRDLCLSPAKS